MGNVSRGPEVICKTEGPDQFDQSLHCQCIMSVSKQLTLCVQGNFAWFFVVCGFFF